MDKGSNRRRSQQVMKLFLLKFSPYNEETRKLREKIKIIWKETFKTNLQRLIGTAYTDSSLWKATRLLKQPTRRIPPIRKADQIWTRSDEEKSEHSCRTFRRYIQTDELPKNEAFQTNQQSAVRITTNNKNKFFTSKEIQDIIQEDLN
jgi:hypothetical protein